MDLSDWPAVVSLGAQLLSNRCSEKKQERSKEACGEGGEHRGHPVHHARWPKIPHLVQMPQVYRDTEKATIKALSSSMVGVPRNPPYEETKRLGST